MLYYTGRGIAHSVASDESDIPPSPFSSFSVSRRAVISLDRTHCELKAFSPKVRSRLPRRECTQLSCPCVGILFQVVRRTLYGVRRVELHLGIDSALDGCFFGLLPCPTVVVEPQGNSVEQVDHDRGERIEGDCEVLIGGETEVSSEGNTEILPGGSEAVVGDTEEQIEAYTEEPIDGDTGAPVEGNI